MDENQQTAAGTGTAKAKLQTIVFNEAVNRPGLYLHEDSGTIFRIDQKNHVTTYSSKPVEVIQLTDNPNMGLAEARQICLLHNLKAGF